MWEFSKTGPEFLGIDKIMGASWIGFIALEMERNVPTVAVVSVSGHIL